MPRSGPLRFRFRWHGWHFEVELRPGPAGWRLRLDADLGPLPYTLEDPARRRASLGLRGRSRLGRFTVDARRHLRHYAELDLDGEPDPPVLVAALVELLLAAKPTYEDAAGLPALAT